MPLTAAVPGGLVVGPLLTDPEWEALRHAHRAGDAGLVCRYAGHPMHPRTSSRGLRHFAHYAGTHAEAEETPDHLALKALCVQIAHAHGWEASTEYPAADRTWVADVIATKDGRSLVFEVQWSRQSDSEYVARSRRYMEAGLEVVWLERVRKDSHPRIKDGDHLRFPFWKSGGNYVDAAHHRLGLEERITEVCSGLLAPGPKIEHVALFTMNCYKCGRPYTAWQMANPGPMWSEKGRGEQDPRVVAAVHRAAPKSVPLAVFKSAYSRTAGKTYEAFHCPHCAAMLGDFHLRNDYLEAEADGSVIRTRVITGEGHTWDTSALERQWRQAQEEAAPPRPEPEPPISRPVAPRLSGERLRDSPSPWPRGRCKPRPSALPEGVRAELDQVAEGTVSQAEHIRNYYARLAAGQPSDGRARTPSADDESRHQGFSAHR